MPRVTWAVSGARDLARLGAFLADKNPAVARRAIAAIRQGVKILAAHPEVGRPMKAMEPAYREWPISFSPSAYLVQIKAGEIVVHACTPRT